MPRLVVLTQYWPPEMGAPQARLSELASRLIGSGWEVDVITALPNYPLGRVFDGYNPWRVAVQEGRARVVRVPLYPAQSGFLRRLISYHSFAMSAIIHGFRKLSKPDILYIESPPLFIGWAAFVLSKLWRCPFVLNVSDLWPRSAVEMGYIKDGPWLWPAWALERALYRRAAGVTGQTVEIVEEVRRTSPSTDTLVVTNGVDPDRFRVGSVSPAASRILGAAPGPIFVYTGLFGHAQGLGQILDAAKMFDESDPGRFVLVGDGPEREQLMARIRNEGISRVQIADAVPRDEVPGLLAGADVAIITLGTRLRGAVPSKIYEAMGASKPILLVAEGEAAERVTSAAAGIAVDIGDQDGLVAAVRQLAADVELRKTLGEAGRKAAESTYNRDAIAKKLDAFLRKKVLPV